MLQFEEALKIVIESHCEQKVEEVSFMKSVNRVLAEDIQSDMDMPPFNKSAVDGFACRKEDIRSTMKIIEVIPAGKMPEKPIGKNECSKIMTGAPLPQGADTILMVEDVEEVSGIIKYLKTKVKGNVCYRGEDIEQGGVVIRKGTLIQPQHIAVMATVGATNIKVYRQVRIGIISTGDELVEPQQKPSRSQIRNSNAYQLITQVEKAGGIAHYMGIALDTEESTRKMISKAFEDNDIILLTGGVSMGDFDYVPAILNELGVTLQFKSIAVQPGRPTVFGKREKQFIFGLPGNPVSSFVQFELLVKPLMYKMMGYAYNPIELSLPLAKGFYRKKNTRLSWKPIKINKAGEAEFIEYHGSAHINALTEAVGISGIPVGISELKKGQIIHVRQI